MDQSGSGGKKIVFKKRILAAQALPEQEADQQQEVSQDEAPEQVDYSHYYYQGEIFDQYYRPLAIEGGEAKLTELAAEPIAAPAPQPKLDRFAREARSREQQEIAEEADGHPQRHGGENPHCQIAVEERQTTGNRTHDGSPVKRVAPSSRPISRRWRVRARRSMLASGRARKAAMRFLR